MLKFWFNLCIKIDPEYSNECAFWHRDKLCHIVTENRTNLESDFDIRLHFLLPRGYFNSGLCEWIKQPRAGGMGGAGQVHTE